MGCVNKPYPIKKQTQITVSKSAKKNYKPPKTLSEWSTSGWMDG